MAYTYDELKHKTVAELRDIAVGIEHEALQGYTQLNKEHLLHALARALGVEEHQHHEVKGMMRVQAARCARSSRRQDRRPERELAESRVPSRGRKR